MLYLIPRRFPFQPAVADDMGVNKTRSMFAVVSPPVEDIMENDRMAYRASSAVFLDYTKTLTPDDQGNPPI